MMRIGPRYCLCLLLTAGCYESATNVVLADLQSSSADGGSTRDRDAGEARDDQEGGAASGSEGLTLCDPDATTPPKSLDCTGLYRDIDAKRIAKAVRSFAPAAALWSDGAKKDRWIYLPPDTQIDNSDPTQWEFPVGTRTWKEFRVDGKRVETRLFWKVAENKWEKATYVWNEDESEAESSFGGDIELADGSSYYVPTKSDCNKCHAGQKDNTLGFSQVLLGLPGAEGVTLADLVDDDLLTDPPDIVELEIGADEAGKDDDGEPLAAQALPILHVNCGISCHNDSPDREAHLTEQMLFLDATQLDGSAPNSSWDIIDTTLDFPAEGKQVKPGSIRIVPGDPDGSLVIQLMESREAAGDSGQMPPLATDVVDDRGVDVVREWIRHLESDG